MMAAAAQRGSSGRRVSCPRPGAGPAPSRPTPPEQALPPPPGADPDGPDPARPRRIVDVSSVGELCRRWFPRDFGRAPKKRSAHTAMSDIRESISELQYYRRAIFKT